MITIKSKGNLYGKVSTQIEHEEHKVYSHPSDEIEVYEESDLCDIFCDEV